ncbi:MAG: hypothetical protein VX642_03510 [Bdellovibrionota bacterium]|nr:hypothetical protein [Bdellovibrionota bacterium]
MIKSKSLIKLIRLWLILFSFFVNVVSYAYPGHGLVKFCKYSVQKKQPNVDLYLDFLGRIQEIDTNKNSKEFLLIQHPEHILAILQNIKDKVTKSHSEDIVPWSNFSDREKTKVLIRAEDFLKLNDVTADVFRNKLNALISAVELHRSFFSEWLNTRSYETALKAQAGRKVFSDLVLKEALKVFSFKLKDPSFQLEEMFIVPQVKKKCWLAIWASLWIVGPLNFYFELSTSETISVLLPILLFPAYMSSSLIHSTSSEKKYWQGLQSFAKASFFEINDLKTNLEANSKSILVKEKLVSLYTLVYLVFFSAWYVDSQALEEAEKIRMQLEHDTRIEAINVKYELSPYERARQEVEENVKKLNRLRSKNYRLDEPWVLEEIEQRRKFYEQLERENGEGSGF